MYPAGLIGSRAVALNCGRHRSITHRMQSNLKSGLIGLNV